MCPYKDYCKIVYNGFYFCIYLYKNLYRVRVRDSMSGGGAEKGETQNPKEAPGSELSPQSPR